MEVVSEGTMFSLLDRLKQQAAQAVCERFGIEREVAESALLFTRSKHADLQTVGALSLAKRCKCSPQEIGKAIQGALEKEEVVLRFELTDRGFLNLWIRSEWLATYAHRALSLRLLGAGQCVVVDYSSPNVAKPMHIAHIRSTILGDAIKRVFQAVGYRVIADNHLGDWGTQFGKLIVAYKKWVNLDAFQANPVQELLRLYVLFSEEEKKQQQSQKGGQVFRHSSDEEEDASPSPLLQEARAELVKLQRGDEQNRALWSLFLEASRRELDKMYQRLGVQFDITLGESFYRDQLASTVEALVQKGLAVEDQGAIIVPLERESTVGEKLPPLLIRKADGGFLYSTTDIATLLYRMEQWNPTWILYVTDERQQLHFKQLFATAKQLGISANLEHIWFGLMRLPEGTISTRQGHLISLEALLDEAEERAFQVACECNPELTEAEAREVARVVGIGAVKYNNLSKDRQTLLTFTWDKALALSGNTAPYLQYAYARTRSILRKAEQQGLSPGAISNLAPMEHELLLRLLWFPIIVEEVAKTVKPHLLCEYLFEVALLFSTFYKQMHVLKAEPQLRGSRLALIDLVSRVLKKGLDLLGIAVLERM
ncbi:arginine--tRNA ligase [Pajaroellobacter abortibovis]|uniref:Arginine--tRNA ligase n=2 Tax=Pajaroellobacter abortibovis TaxID=1882918 RepID=A0A1L6MZE5_9BACT|nr:arginine--tRNA ligase [Pajaroellobacter abortibovis]